MAARAAFTSSAETALLLFPHDRADVGQHGGEIGIGQSRAHRRHGKIPFLAGDLNRAVESGQRNARERRHVLGDPFGTGQRRRLAGFAQTVAAMADAANGFIDRLAVGQHRGGAGLGLVKRQLFGVV